MRNETDIFKVLSEPNRVRILMMLRGRELCVCDITKLLALRTATVSSHLSMLREKGFITDEKRGKWIYYRIAERIDNPIIIDILEKLPIWFANNQVIGEDALKLNDIVHQKITCN